MSTWTNYSHEVAVNLAVLLQFTDTSTHSEQKNFPLLLNCTQLNRVVYSLGGGEREKNAVVTKMTLH